MSVFIFTEIKSPVKGSEQWNSWSVCLVGEKRTVIHTDTRWIMYTGRGREKKRLKLKLISSGINILANGAKEQRPPQGMENSANSTEGKATLRSMDVHTGNRWQHSTEKQRFLRIMNHKELKKFTSKKKKPMSLASLFPSAWGKPSSSRTHGICQTRTLVLTMLFNYDLYYFLHFQNTLFSFSWWLQTNRETEPGSKWGWPQSHWPCIDHPFLFSSKLVKQDCQSMQLTVGVFRSNSRVLLPSLD